MKKRTIIIAEAGVNHNGNLDSARLMIEKAKEAGADIIKFQTFNASSIVSRNAVKADYQIKNTNSAETQYEMLKKLELDENSHIELLKYCKKTGIEFLSTPFDIKNIEFLKKIGMSIWKIPSGEITNLPYLKTIGRLNNKVLLSTGMSTLGEVEMAIDILVNSGTSRNKITLLHCTTEYPAPIEDINLSAIVTMRNAFNIECGYSDHTLSIAVPIAAVAIGATIIEKHFTLNRNMEGPDHKASLEPHELAEMVQAIRTVETSMGDGIKKPSISELKNRNIARKSIVASRSICKGEFFSPENLAVKRPGNGLSPMMWDTIVGRKAYKDFDEDELIIL